MGLDIHLLTDNYDELSESEAFDDLEESHRLSRSFCNLMCRKNVVENPELDQIATMFNIDLTPLYAMEEYVSEQDLEDLDGYETEEEHSENLQRNQAVEGNIDRILALLDNLIGKLLQVPDLHFVLAETTYDTIGITHYFSDFNASPGDGYIGNNFGQDLRNFQLIAAYAKAHGANTIYFTYG
jgi:hypothetical protein